jgi:hypothetical protein
MIHPKGNLVLIGEAASPHHAWVVGALESAVYGVDLWLRTRASDISGATDAIDLLEKAVVGVPFVGLPPYMNPTIVGWSAVNASLDLEAAAAEN